MNRWLFQWRRLSRELWVLATAYAAFGVAAALLATVGAPWVPPEMATRLGGKSVEQILAVLASSLLAVATFSVGAMVTAYTAVSSAATPRVATLVTGDKQTQRSLATFVGAFLYAIVALTAVNARYYGEGGRAILFLVSLAVVALVAYRLLAWINRLSRLARVGHMVELVEERASEALDERRRRPFLGGRPGALDGGADIPSPRTGYVENVDPARLQDCAERYDCLAQVLTPPGAFVRRGDPLLRVRLDHCDADTADAFANAFIIGRSRSYEQDPRFALIVLGEIAARALSPGVNDPGTAVQVIGAGVRLLDDWLRPDLSDPPPRTCDRVMAPGLDEADLLDDVFGPIARYGAGDMAAAMRLLKALRIFAATPGPMQAPARLMGENLLRRARRALPISQDVDRLEAVWR